MPDASGNLGEGIVVIMPPPSFDFFTYVKDGGAYCSPLLLAALMWMLKERNNLLEKLEKKSDRLEVIVNQTIVLMAELRLLMNGKGVGK